MYKKELYKDFIYHKLSILDFQSILQFITYEIGITNILSKDTLSSYYLQRILK